MRHVRLSILVFVSLTIAAVRPHGQVRASTQPISGDTVVLRLMIGSEPARFGVQNGGLARLNVKDGPTLGLMPGIRGSAVDLTVFRIWVDPATGNEGIRQLGSSRRLEKGHVERFEEAGLVLDAELIEINPGQIRPSDPSGPCTTCCVSCGSVMMCACWVILDCGRCCCETACTCWESTESGKNQPLTRSGCGLDVTPKPR